MKKSSLAPIILTAVAIALTACTATQQRDLKTMSSNWGGGLDRTVTLYDYNGNEIKSWSGKFDVSDNDQETYFDINGKRVIIKGGIVVNEEN